jgi:hypothetical protein
MDIWITLRDGRTAPMTGVTGVTSVDTVGTATEFTGASITSGSPNVTVASTAGIRPGSNVYGSGIPTGATVLSITSATVFVLSANATDTIGSQTITVTTVTDADLKLLTVNSGWYRDIFTPDGIRLGALTSATLDTMTAALVSDVSITSLEPPTVEGTISTSNSDEIGHAALRQATWLESLWCFSCTVESDTLSCYYRKIDVIGWCNVAPSL